jgi:tol-pal system protein YbgF
MQQTRVVLTSLALLALCGCATQSEVESLRRDTDEMKSRIFTMDKNISEVRGEVREGVEKSLAGYRKTLEDMQKDVASYQKDMAAIRKAGADLQATLDSARVDMQVLTGKIDDVRIMAQKPAEDIALLREDHAKSMTALEDRLSKLEARLTEQQKKTAEAAQQTPEAIYQQGLDAYKAGDSAKAREILAKFLEQHPKHKLAANAHYWIGETYYAEKNYEQAVLEFQDVIKNYHDKEKVPAAMLKQAMAFKELGDNKSAQYIYKKLVDEYPKSDEAKSAREKLQPAK